MIRVKTVSPGFKQALNRSSFFLEHFGGYFVSIKGTVAKIRAKTLLRLL